MTARPVRRGRMQALALAAGATLALAAAAPRGGTPRTQPPANAAAAFDSLPATYRALRSYRLEGVSRVDVAGGGMRDSLVSPVRFVVRRPSHVALEVQNPMSPMVAVADGESLWVWARGVAQVTAEALASRPGSADDSLGRARMLDPAWQYQIERPPVTRVVPLGRDTVRLAGRVATCRRWLASAPPDSAGRVAGTRVLWVDDATGLVLRDSVHSVTRTPQAGEIESIQSTRFVVAERDPALADSLFRFVMPADARRVRRFLVSSPEHADLEGHDAFDFTLPTLDGSRVTLSALRGHVVVLDFWATWCGPCRGWLPVVARTARELAPRGLRVFAVNLRESPALVRSYLSKQGLELPVLLDAGGDVGQRYRATSIPLTVVIGRDGRVVRVLLGLHTEPDLREALAEAGIE